VDDDVGAEAGEEAADGRGVADVDALRLELPARVVGAADELAAEVAAGTGDEEAHPASTLLGKM
jgi:hypothetical protein